MSSSKRGSTVSATLYSTKEFDLFAGLEPPGGIVPAVPGAVLELGLVPVNAWTGRNVASETASERERSLCRRKRSTKRECGRGNRETGTKPTER